LKNNSCCEKLVKTGREIQVRHIGNCMKADPDYGKGVADALGIPLSELPKAT